MKRYQQFFEGCYLNNFVVTQGHQLLEEKLKNPESSGAMRREDSGGYNDEIIIINDFCKYRLS